jgi:hypothetical protein
MLVSGMIVGTLFTLLVVPSIYMLIARKREVEPILVPSKVEDERELEVAAV